MLRQTELMQVSDVRGIVSHLVAEEPVLWLRELGTRSRRCSSRVLRTD